jgi:YidC/Oxa1 family membrane protein insertase
MSTDAPSPPAEEEPSPPQDLSASGLTIPSESEAFSSLSPPSTSPPQSSSNNNHNNDGREGKVVLYRQPTFWSLVRGAAINLLLPFVNGMMLGLGELLAHEIAFRWGWGTTQVSKDPWSKAREY